MVGLGLKPTNSTLLYIHKHERKGLHLLFGILSKGFYVIHVLLHVRRQFNFAIHRNVLHGQFRQYRLQFF